MEKKIENLLENVFEKVSKEKLNVTIHYPNSTKIQISCQRCSNPTSICKF